MRNLMLAIVTVLMVSSCTSTYQTASVYDDVYYSPGTSNQAEVQKRLDYGASGVSYGSNTSDDRFENTVQPEAEVIGSSNIAQTSGYYQDTLAQPESSSNEYYYSEDSDEYYDYEYATRIKRFHQDCGDFGYYAPVYTNTYWGGYYPGFSMGFGWGWPSSYFSLSYNYGWGYPYYGYYDPWYSWYDPWYYPYYGYGSSYWMGYNHGYYNGYWNGYYAGGYYPEGGGYGYGYHYGPRGTRGSGLIGSTGERESRITNNVSVEKTAPAASRETRVEPGSQFGSGLSNQTNNSANSEKVNRQAEVQKNTATVVATQESREVRAEKIAKPSSVVPSENNSKNEAVLRETRSNTVTESTKLSKPVVNNQPAGVAQDRNTRNTSTIQQQKVAKPASSTAEGNTGVVSRDKKYAKPASNTLEKQAPAKNYSSPVYNKPRSSNEYTVPGSRTIRNTNQGTTTVERSAPAPAQQNTIRTSTPSKSNNSFSNQSKGSINNSSSRPVRSYSSPSSTTTPQRSYSAPARSSGSGGSYSSPSSGGSSRSSGSSSGGSSSGSSSGGRRGR